MAWCLQKRANITIKANKKSIKNLSNKNLQMTRRAQIHFNTRDKTNTNQATTFAWLWSVRKKNVPYVHISRGKQGTPSLPCQIYKETTSTTFSSPWKLLHKKNAIPSSCNLKAEDCFSSQLYETANIQYHLKWLLGTTFLSNEKTWLKNPAQKHASSRPTSQLKWYHTKNAIIIHAHISRGARS